MDASAQAWRESPSVTPPIRGLTWSRVALSASQPPSPQCWRRSRKYLQPPLSCRLNITAEERNHGNRVRNHNGGRTGANTHVRSDRKSVVEGKSVSVSVDRGGRRNIKTKK